MNDEQIIQYVKLAPLCFLFAFFCSLGGFIDVISDSFFRDFLIGITAALVVVTLFGFCSTVELAHELLKRYEEEGSTE